jgi:uncharacterized membrane protein
MVPERELDKAADTGAPASTISPVRVVALSAPLSWLGRGWADLWRKPAASLFYGVAVALAGAVILVATMRLPYLFTAAITGFLLVGPMLAAGLYELSRCYHADEPASLRDSMLAWRRNPSGLIGFGLLSLLAGTIWQMVSIMLVTLFYKGSALAPMELVLEVMLNPRYLLLFIAYLGTGGLIAALVFAASVVSMPMLVDRRGELLTAITTSLHAVAENPLPLALWATIIMVLTAIGFATALIGLILILPWLGHASFHAYKDLVV